MFWVSIDQPVTPVSPANKVRYPPPGSVPSSKLPLLIWAEIAVDKKRHNAIVVKNVNFIFI
jgi:hypothetical protein